MDSGGRMDGADVWLSVRDGALRNPHIFQNALKSRVRQSIILKIFMGDPGRNPRSHLKGGHFAEGKKVEDFTPTNNSLICP